MNIVYQMKLAKNKKLKKYFIERKAIFSEIIIWNFSKPVNDNLKWRTKVCKTFVRFLLKQIWKIPLYSVYCALLIKCLISVWISNSELGFFTNPQMKSWKMSTKESDKHGWFRSSKFIDCIVYFLRYFPSCNQIFCDLYGLRQYGLRPKG